MIKQQIEQDLKTALLGGDKVAVTALRTLKSAVLYAEVAAGSRESGLAEADVIAVLSKEAKKREESAVMYDQAGATDRAAAERAEKALIEKYLPASLSEDEIMQLIDAAVVATGAASAQDMGKVMAELKPKIAGRADGAVVARLVKTRLA